MSFYFCPILSYSFFYEGLEIDTFLSEAAEVTRGIFFSKIVSLEQISTCQDHPKHNYLIQKSKLNPHKQFKVSPLALGHPVCAM